MAAASASSVSGTAPKRIDLHVHVGVLGDDPAFKPYGAISPWMREQLVYRIMLLYARVDPARVSDVALRDALLATVAGSSLDHVVCLALDPAYDRDGTRRPERSNLWVDNSYITRELAPRSGGRILLGASVHPYDPRFEQRVDQCLADGAVLLKWLPSAQWIDLADPRVLKALRYLATARGGRPLPLLVHVGAEYAIMTTDPRTTSYDFLSWGFLERLVNRLRPAARRWHTPNLSGALANLRAGLDAGATVILAHCGLPYFAPRFLGFLEHNDIDVVARLLRETADRAPGAGRCYADVSACVTPFREGYWSRIASLPRDSLLAGSDFPVPVFELSAGPAEYLDDFRAMVTKGELERIVVPENNLLDVNWRELEHAFGAGHPMFRTAERLLL
jgi:hypothetical protein